MTELLDRPASELSSDDAREPAARRRARRAAVAGGVVVVLVVVLAFAIGGGSGGSGSEGSGSGGVAGTGGSRAAGSNDAGTRAAGGLSTAPAPAAGSSESGSAAAPATPGVPLQPGVKVVKTGEMDLAVPKGQVSHIVDRVTAVASLERGFVSDSHANDGTDPSASVTLRVPVERFDATLLQVRRLPVKVTSQQTGSSDVTGSYVDLQARLRSLTATRSAFERILARATTIGDTLAVQARITDVQTQIEQLQGQLRVLTDQTSYATLVVTVDQVSAPAPVSHHRSGMSAAWHRSVTRFVHGIEAIVGALGPIVLAVLILAAGYGVARLGYRVVRRRFA